MGASIKYQMIRTPHGRGILICTQRCVRCGDVCCRVMVVVVVVVLCVCVSLFVTVCVRACACVCVALVVERVCA